VLNTAKNNRGSTSLIPLSVCWVPDRITAEYATKTPAR
jgi:hypothetical protein